MRRHLGSILLAVFVVLVLLISTVTYTVDEQRDVVIVTTFGRVTDVQDPREDPDAAGLHLKLPWPIQSIVRYDARNYVFEDPYEQVETADHKLMLVATYATWRIAEPKIFIERVPGGTVEAGQEQIRKKLRDAKRDGIGAYGMGKLINTQPEEMKLEKIEKDILAEVRNDLREAYGVEVIQVRVKLWGLPDSVTSAVIDMQKKDRLRDVERYRAEGEAQATAIIERAKSAATQILAFANRKAEAIRNEGIEQSRKYYKEFAQNPKLSRFLRWLETLRTSLSGKTVLVMDGTELPALKLLRGEVEPGDLPTIIAPETLEPAVKAPTTRPAEGVSPRTEVE